MDECGARTFKVTIQITKNQSIEARGAATTCRRRTGWISASEIPVEHSKPTLLDRFDIKLGPDTNRGLRSVFAWAWVASGAAWQEFQEKRGSMPLKLTEVIDRIYKVINDEQQKVKKLLKDIDSIDKPFRERVETALLNAINDIGQKAQHLRPDQARLKSCAPIDPVRDGGSEQSQRVEVAHRFKWLSGTLHLVVRKCWSEDRSEDAKMEIIVQHVPWRYPVSWAGDQSHCEWFGHLIQQT